MENKVENNPVVEDDSPVYYNTNHLSLIAILSGVFSWIILAGYITYVVISILFLKSQLTNGVTLSQVLQDPSAQSWIYNAIGSPFMLGIVFFLVLQGVSLGLNVLLELDVNSQD